jgi:hypothetical protein
MSPAPLRILVITSRPMIDQQGSPVHLPQIAQQARDEINEAGA